MHFASLFITSLNFIAFQTILQPPPSRFYQLTCLSEVEPYSCHVVISCIADVHITTLSDAIFILIKIARGILLILLHIATPF